MNSVILYLPDVVPLLASQKEQLSRSIYLFRPFY